MTETFDNVEAYLAHVGRLRNQPFGQRFRGQFRDTRGTAELAMLAAPSAAEYEDFCRLVAAMTDDEKRDAASLGDEQLRAIARRAGADCGRAAIFINGYVLQRKAR